jgi:hypothetical protein
LPEDPPFRYRFVTPALTGPWLVTREEALQSALAAGQAYRQAGLIIPYDFARIESEPAAPARRDHSDLWHRHRRTRM